MRQLPELHTKFIEVGKEWPENSTFAHFGHTLEDRVLAHMESFISVKFGPSQFSLHIDGLLVNGASATNDAGFKNALQALVRDTTGFTWGSGTKITSRGWRWPHGAFRLGTPLCFSSKCKKHAFPHVVNQHHTFNIPRYRSIW